MDIIDEKINKKNNKIQIKMQKFLHFFFFFRIRVVIFEKFQKYIKQRRNTMDLQDNQYKAYQLLVAIC